MAQTFPAPLPSGIYSLRFYQTGTGTAAFSGNQFAFEHPDGSGNRAWSNNIRIKATGVDVEFSFDGTNVHGKVTAGTEVIYNERHEGGIAVRGNGATFLIEAW